MSISFTEAALAVLFLLREAGLPLSMDQIAEAIGSSSEYTYLDTAIAVNDMCDKGFLQKEKSNQDELFTVTIEGRVNLSRLTDRIRGTVRKSLTNYTTEHFNELTLGTQIFTDKSPLGNGRWQVMLRSFDNGSPAHDLVLIVSDEAEADQLIKGWKKHADKAIAALYSVLLTEK